MYYPSEKHIKTIKKIAKQVDLLLVCNNTPDDKIQDSIDNCEIINFGENLGLSAAFNKAIDMAGIDWDAADYCVFFDQDSNIEDGYIDRLVSSFKDIATLCDNLGVMGPVYKDEKNGAINLPSSREPIEGTNAYIVQSIITSSMIIQYGTLKEIGFWNENVFLDMADFDLCWRLSENGYKIVVDSDVILSHSVGEEVFSVFGKQLQVWKPVRNYYRIRDGLKLYHSGYMPSNEKRRFIITLSAEQLLNFIMVGERLDRIKFYLKAIKDYKKNLNGSYEKYR